MTHKRCLNVHRDQAEADYSLVKDNTQSSVMYQMMKSLTSSKSEEEGSVMLRERQRIREAID